MSGEVLVRTNAAPNADPSGNSRCAHPRETIPHEVAVCDSLLVIHTDPLRDTVLTGRCGGIRARRYKPSKYLLTGKSHTNESPRGS